LADCLACLLGGLLTLRNKALFILNLSQGLVLDMRWQILYLWRNLGEAGNRVSFVKWNGFLLREIWEYFLRFSMALVVGIQVQGMKWRLNVFELGVEASHCLNWAITQRIGRTLGERGEFKGTSSGKVGVRVGRRWERVSTWVNGETLRWVQQREPLFLLHGLLLLIKLLSFPI
jgi:hypothetical protein